jgi:hypothetical protein
MNSLAELTVKFLNNYSSDFSTQTMREVFC